MSIKKLDLYFKHLNGLRLEDEIYMRCLEEDVKTINNAERHTLTEEGKAEVAKWKAEIDKGYEELKKRVMKGEKQNG